MTSTRSSRIGHFPKDKQLAIAVRHKAATASREALTLQAATTGTGRIDVRGLVEVEAAHA